MGVTCLEYLDIASFSMADRIDTGSTSFRFVLVGALTLASLIPLGLVSCVASDRSANYESAVNNIGMSWGKEQQISGPVILIPIATEKDENAAFVAVMPETLQLRMSASHQIRQRGIFEVPVLEIEAIASGSFPAVDLDSLGQRFGPLRAGQTAISVGIADTRGIRSADLRWGGKSMDLVTLPKGPFGSGISAPLGRSLGNVVEIDMSNRDFEVDLNLRGTRRFSVVANGDTSNIKMESTWPHPSFTGRFLPDEREVGPDGFTASYTVSGLARGFPSIFRVSASKRNNDFANESLGFEVFEPVNLYSSVQRSVKYGILFVALTLVGLLCLELSTGIRFHFVQYAVTIIALAMFFMTLLALAEYIGFTPSYLLSAALLTGMITWYANGTIKKRRLTAMVATMLAALYAVMYLLLRLESYSLLVGTAVLLLTLAILMRTTRRLTPVAEGDGKD